MSVVYRKNGRVCTRDEFLKGAVGLGGCAVQTSKGRKYPYASDAFGCHPEQREEFTRVLRQEHGISTQFTPGGEAIITDRRHFKRMLKAYGLRDRSGYD